MSLHDDLLEQAHDLAQREGGRGRPKQASLRRSISTAYYALFHLLVHDASGRLIGTSVASSGLRDQVARAYNHNEMKSVCKSFRSGYNGLSPHLKRLIPSQVIPPDLETVADTFVNLQEERHKADYGRAMRFRRIEVLDLLKEVTEAFAAWERVRQTAEAKVFLLALIFDSRWNR